MCNIQHATKRCLICVHARHVRIQGQPDEDLTDLTTLGQVNTDSTADNTHSGNPDIPGLSRDTENVLKENENMPH